MKNAFIFHGTGGYPEENWFPWMKQELETRGYHVDVPQFPTPENQTPESWFEVLDLYKKNYSENTILIGHSLGGAFLLRVLEQFNAKVKAVFLVGTPIGIPPIANTAGDKPFTGHPYDWEKIRQHSEKFTVYHSDTDPYVGLENGKQLAKNLGAELTFIPNAGHFNKAAGYLKFEELLKEIDKLKI